MQELFRLNKRICLSSQIQGPSAQNLTGAGFGESRGGGYATPGCRTCSGSASRSLAVRLLLLPAPPRLPTTDTNIQWPFGGLRGPNPNRMPRAPVLRCKSVPLDRVRHKAQDPAVGSAKRRSQHSLNSQLLLRCNKSVRISTFSRKEAPLLHCFSSSLRFHSVDFA